MIKKAWDFISDRGYIFMAAGICIVIVAAVMLVKDRQAGEVPGAYIWPLAATGLGVYIIGRIGVMSRNRRDRRRRMNRDSESPE
jgi:hypothetical protein